MKLGWCRATELLRVTNSSNHDRVSFIVTKWFRGLGNRCFMQSEEIGSSNPLAYAGICDPL